MQVGPLAQILVGYAAGDERTKRWTDEALELASTISGKSIKLEHLQSTLGRHLARGIRTAMLSELALEHWNLLVENIGKGDLTIWEEPVFPKGEIRGFGVHEAPRGTLSHWVVIKNGRIENYQCVVPSTWNAGPRDQQDQRGPYEESLIGNPVADAEKPLELLRTIHSFDPCLACAIHTYDPTGNQVAAVKVL